MKYVIDIPDNVKKIVYFHLGNANAVWTTSNVLDDLEQLNSDYINEHFPELQDTAYKRGINDGSLDVKQRAEGAYQKGYNDGKEYGLDESDMREAVSYQRGVEDGRNETWECMKRIAFLEKPRDMRDFFGCSTLGGVLIDYYASEAIEKLKAYEEKQKADELKVGDELEHTVSGYTSKAIFLEKIEDDEDWYKCLFWTSCGFAILSYPKSQFKRTGKHFDIDKILEEMNHED